MYYIKVKQTTNYLYLPVFNFSEVYLDVYIFCGNSTCYKNELYSVSSFIVIHATLSLTSFVLL